MKHYQHLGTVARLRSAPPALRLSTAPIALFCASSLMSIALGCSSSDSQPPQSGPSNGPSAGGSGSGSGNGNGNGNGGNPAAAGSTAGPNPIVTPTLPAPGTGQPAPEATTDVDLPDAPPLGAISFVPNRSSVRLYLPGVAGAKDYRVFALEDGVVVSKNGSGERVEGATIHCAGWRQRNQCDDGAILPVKYNTEDLDMPKCEIEDLDRRPNVPTALMQTLEVNGIGPDTTLVVEAIDRQCPFPGLFGSRADSVEIGSSDIGGKMVDVVVNDEPYSIKRFPDSFPLRTEAQIRADYGSMILNGQGWNMPTLDASSPAFPESPYIRIGQPAPAEDPVVLARAIVKVSPSGTAELPEGFRETDYFDDFDDPTDQPKLLRDTDPTNELTGVPIKVYTTKKWVLYDSGNHLSDFFVDRGQMHMVQADPFQNTMSAQSMYPKRPVQLPSEPDSYLHVTYEAQRNETARRYENLALCGSDTAGQTYDGDTPRAAPLPRPGFMNGADTARTSVLGWNCLLLVPRGPGYWRQPAGDANSHADAMLAITVIGSHAPPKTGGDYDSVRISDSAQSFGPTQEDPSPKRWMRQIDSEGNKVGVWLDDQLNVWQRTRFDVFIRRDRVVIYVEGEQRICQELTGKPLTMAEGALGFWHVLYHSSAEFMEIRRGLPSDNPSTGQHHIIHNTPFADQRSWDNVGFRENVELPSKFDASLCYPD
jgi:hypothetical protein